MIFKQWQQVLAGTKTQTRRLVKPLELSWHRCDMSNSHIALGSDALRNFDSVTLKGRVRWKVGRDYAVVPGRGLPAVLWRGNETPTFVMAFDPKAMRGTGREWKHKHLSAYDDGPHPLGGWREARILLTDIRRERLWNVTEEDAVAEGCKGYVTYSRMAGEPHLEEPEDLYSPREEYAQLWDSINKTRGTRWGNNPEVWVLTFALVK